MWDWLIEWLNANLLGVATTAFGTALLALFKPVRVWAEKMVWGSCKWLWAAISALPSHLRLYNFVLSRKPFWSFGNGRKQKNLNGPTVITVMNFKGGVGKTTIAANLAASLAGKFEKRVLVVDLDYQGSLTDLLRRSTIDASDVNLAATWLHSKFPVRAFEELIITSTNVPNVALISAEYGLTETEDNELLRWLMGLSGDDVRSRLLRRLKRASLEIETRYDYIIMDAPPRMSLAAANALKASDYVLIPAKLQFLAVSPVQKMLEYLSTFKKIIRARFTILGVVCNMTEGAQPVGNEGSYLEQVQSAITTHADRPVVFETLVPDRKDIGRPEGATLGYMLRGRDGEWVRTTFDALSRQILDRIDALKSSPNRP